MPIEPAPWIHVLVFYFLIPVGVFVLLRTVLAIVQSAVDNRAKAGQERIRVLEEALRAGDIDEQLKQDLVQSLSGRRVTANTTPPAKVGFLVKLIAFIGWVSLSVGIAFLIIVESVSGWSGSAMRIPAVLLPCVGFGLVTYPFVIRELQSAPRHRLVSTQGKRA